MSLLHWLAQADALNQLVAVVLCVMSVVSWVVIIYKTWLLSVANRDLALCQAAWSQAPDWKHVQSVWSEVDRQKLYIGLLINPLADAAHGLSAHVSAEDRLSSSLRQALQHTRRRLQWGQDLLATMGATSPFIGLLGTVWGIYHALVSLAQAGQYTLDKVAQPVGESLVMTAAGLGVAIPAVMAYNLLGRRLASMDTTLDALAFDVRAYLLSQSR